MLVKSYREKKKKKKNRPNNLIYITTVGQFSKFCLRQQLCGFKKFCMETRLSNVFKTTKVTNLTQVIQERSYRVLQVTSK